MKRLTTTTIQRTSIKLGNSLWITDDVEQGLRVRITAYFCNYEHQILRSVNTCTLPFSGNVFLPQVFTVGQV